ncbi:putative lectin [uncultured phage_MedDCM-OCT-S39-C11]|uniref:Putative lectin n=1 Tax=uncultured phage_MedDCM-OCT-S39-C11 TaxID=2740805 RepID=A0A6S4PIY8_9CAUD|nr:putative lectin [uncultured phage_MedDCM-OCT-S39-C11]BAQ94496.1 putative lectin [uncultured phage_MedDCM-OCT-S39-C11]
MSTIRDTDQFLVQRGTNSYKQSAKDLMSTIKDTDLMLVQRGEASYKVTCLDVKDQLGGDGGGDLETVTLAPLSLTINPDGTNDITAVTNLTEILPNSEITFKWYRYDDPTGGTGTLLDTTVSDTAIQDTYTVKSSDQGKYIGCTVFYLSNAGVDETERSQVNTAAVPVAVMQGLRFDPGRETYLERSCENLTGAFTFSCWIKITQNTTNGFLLGFDQGSYGDGIFVNADNPSTLYYTDGSATPQLSDIGAIPHNQWTHIVVTYSGESENQFNAYINNVRTGYTPTDAVTSSLIRIGRNTTGNYFSGYLSDYYFVDGSVMPPTTFAKKFALGWGPLDSSVVLDKLYNIEPSDPTPPPGPGEAGQPYDSRANTASRWSDGLTSDNGAFGTDKTLAFNGVLTDSAQSDSAFGTLTLSLNETVNKSLRVYRSNGVGSSDPQPTISANGGDAVNFPINEWFEIDFTGMLTSLVTTDTAGSKASLSAVEIDGRVLVDNGLWNVEQNWSDLVAGSATSSNPITKAFDGQEQEGAIPAYGTLCRLELPSVTSGVIEVTGYRADVGSTLSINGVAQSTTSNEYFRVSATINSALDLYWTSVGSTDYFRVDTISIDGAILVDSGAQWDTSQVWSNGVSTSAGSFTSDGAPSKGFDGDLTTQCYANSGSAELTVNLSYYNLSGDVAVAVGSPTLEAKVIANGSIAIDWTEVGAKNTLVSLGTVNNIEKIEIRNSGGGSGNFTAISIGGKVLVDATPVWNTSQRWSSNGDDSTTNASGNYGWSQAFDGNFTTKVSAQPSATSECTFTGLTGTKFEIRAYKNGSAANLKVNGSNATISTPTGGGWVDVSALVSGQLNTISVQDAGGGSYTQIMAIAVDGAILVDAAPTWNTSQVWSSGSQNGDFNKPVTAVFDGNAETVAQAITSGTAIHTFATPFTGSKFEAFVQYGNASGVQYSVTLDGSDESASAPSADKQWITLYDGTSKECTKLKIACGAGGGGDIALLRVDGALLVDGGFGANGFFLPFDPTEDGANYNQYISGGPFEATKPGENAFDGSTSTSASKSGSSGSGQFWTWEPTGLTIPVANKLRLFCRIESGGFIRVTCNGAVETLNGDKAEGWHEVPNSADKDLQKIEVSGGNTVPGNSALFAVEIDNAILVDHSSIGVDMSGNDNHFHDKNFGVGDSSQVWSSLSDITGNIDNGSLFSVFSGIEEGALPGGLKLANGAVFTFNMPSFLFTEASNKLRFSGGETANLTIAVKYDAITLTNSDAVYSATGNSSTYDFDIPQNKTVEFKVTGGAGGWTNYIAVNGVKLVDKNQVDTVLDTPMNNYAVLGSGNRVSAKNGNLVAYKDGGGGGAYTNLDLDTSKKYYFEVTTELGVNSGAGVINSSSMGNPGEGEQPGVYGIFSWEDGKYYRFDDTSKTDLNVSAESGNVLGIAVDMKTKTITTYKDGVEADTFTMSNTDDNESYRFVAMLGNTTGIEIPTNFGQQPFVYVIRNEDGTATIPATYNTSKIWSDDVVGVANPQLAFDGSSTEVLANTNNTDIVFTPNLGSGPFDVEVLVNDISSPAFNTVTIDGSTLTRPSPGSSAKFIGTVSSFNTMTISNSNGTANFRSVKVNGSILVDSDVFNTLQNWSGNTSGSPSGAGFGWANGFNGSITTPGASGSGIGTPTYIANFDTAITGLSELIVFVAKGQSLEDNASIVLEDDTVVPIILGDIVSSGSGTGYSYGLLNTSKFSSIKGIGVNQAIQITAVKVNGAYLVNASGGTYNLLYQTWSEQKRALEEARAAQDQQRISQLETVIIEQSIPFERDTQYPKGAIVDIAGELYEAQVDGADVRAADFIARLFREGSEEWLKLDISTRQRPSFSPQPTPTPEPVPTPEPFPSGGTSDQGFDPGSISSGFSTGNG